MSYAFATAVALIGVLLDDSVLTSHPIDLAKRGSGVFNPQQDKIKAIQ
jgi:hypothetical protein